VLSKTAEVTWRQVRWNVDDEWALGKNVEGGCHQLFQAIQLLRGYYFIPQSCYMFRHKITSSD
jgi:hypothetical protein